MPELLMVIIIGCMALFVLLASSELFTGGRRLVAAVELLLIFAVGVALYSHGLAPGPTPFGDSSLDLTAALVFFSAMLGVAANYIFSHRGKFFWRSVAKAVLITPITVLPVLNSVLTCAHVDRLGYFSFALLGFQNGFFWKTLFDALTPRARRDGTSSPPPPHGR